MADETLRVNLSAVMAGQPGPAFGRPGRKLDRAISLRDALCRSKRDHRIKPGAALNGYLFFAI